MIYLIITALNDLSKRNSETNASKDHFKIEAIWKNP